MTTVVNFFATRDDLLPGLAVIDESMELQYVECGDVSTKAVDCRTSLLDYSSLGFNTTGNHLSPCYLVTPRARRVAVREIVQRNGMRRLVIDQAENVPSIVIQPGGRFSAEALVAGHVGTMHQDRRSLEMQQSFSRLLTTGFKRMKGYVLGPEARSLLASGIRLVTVDVKQAPQFDLSAS